MFYSDTRKFLEQFNISGAKTFVFTGTKGKTTLGLLLSAVLRPFFNDLIRIDSTGVYWNDEKLFSKDESVNHFGYPPSVYPGRYLYGLFKNKMIDLSKMVVILEASLTSGVYGTGIFQHDVGILTNIYSDHIDYERICNRDDLFSLKSFVFKEIKKGGKYVVNLDNDLSYKSIFHPSLNGKNIQIVGISTQLSIAESLKILEQTKINSILLNIENKILKLPDNIILFENDRLIDDTVASYNTMMCIAAVLGDSKINLRTISEILRNFNFPEDYGRNLQFNKASNHLYIDFAHEEESQRQLVKKVNKQCNEKPFLITRISPDHSFSYIDKYANCLSQFPLRGVIIYDKVDGKEKQIFRNRNNEERRVGETANYMFKILKRKNPNYLITKIVSEIEALEYALNKSMFPLIHIYNNLPEVLDFIKIRGFKRFLG